MLKKFVVIAVLTFVFTAGPNQVSAKSQCKGLTSSVCKSKSNCSWVSLYRTKRGKVVKAHCRSKRKAKTLRKSTSKTNKSRRKVDNRRNRRKSRTSKKKKK